MQILHLLASDDRRGAEVFGCDLASALDARGHDDQVVALTAASGALEVEVLPALQRAAAARELRRRALRADLVLAHGSRGLVAGSLATVGARTPLVYRSIGDPRYWGASRSRRLRVGAQLRRAAAVTALWTDAADAIARQYGVHRTRLHVVPNAADADRFTPADEAARASARARFEIEAGRPAFAYVGALADEKRVDLVVGAVSTMPDATLLVAGDGPARRVIAATAAQMLPGRHRLLGSVADVREVYAAVDAIVLLSATEGQPGVAIEAGLSGVPVVATDVGGVRSIVLDGITGFVVSSPPDPTTVAAKLAEAAARRAELGAAARERCATRFSMDEVVARFEVILRRTLDVRGPAR